MGTILKMFQDPQKIEKARGRWWRSQSDNCDGCGKGEVQKRKGWRCVRRRSQGMFDIELGILVEADLTSHPAHVWKERGRKCHLLYHSYRLPTTLSHKFRLLYFLSFLQCFHKFWIPLSPTCCRVCVSMSVCLCIYPSLFVWNCR